MNAKVFARGAEVLVFKTNIRDAADPRLRNTLAELPDILHWNVDLDDCDKVLRVESQGLQARQLIWALSKAGYHCQELED